MIMCVFFFIDMVVSLCNIFNKDIGVFGDLFGRGDIEIWF